jgi:hypothetical protein
VNEKEYVHVHPGVENGKFDLRTTIAKPGTYRGWMQFNADHKIHTIDFTLNVARGSKADVKNTTEGHNTAGEDHSNH